MRVSAIVFLVVACAIALVAADVEVAFEDCGTAGDLGKINRITSSIFPPKSNTHMSMHQHHNSMNTITGGTYSIITKLGSLTVDTKTGDVCTYGNFKCGAAKGAVMIDLETDVGQLISGTFTVTSSAKDSTGASIFCHKTTMKV